MDFNQVLRHGMELAMLIPAESLWGYPLQVLCGAAVLMALAWGYGKIVNS